MFDRIKSKWRGARVSVLDKRAQEILERYDRSTDPAREEFLRTFEVAFLSAITDYGPYAYWTTKITGEAAKRIRSAAAREWASSPTRSDAGVLLGIFLELETLTEESAKEVRDSIQQRIDVMHERYLTAANTDKKS
jgi:hypothetical protein